MQKERKDPVEALALVLLGKIERSAGELNKVLVTRRIKTQEKEEGLTREEVVESQEEVDTGVIDHRALKNLTAALKDLRSILPEGQGEKEILVRFLGGEDAWNS